MSTPKPAILIVHGAFHPPACYDPLTTKLQAAGFEVVVPRLPSIGEGVFGVTLDEDVALVRQSATLLFESRKEVILVGHSYGGFLATVVAKDYSVEERAAKGQQGGFRGIVYLAGTLTDKGKDTTASTNPALTEVLEITVVDGKVFAVSSTSPYIFMLTALQSTASVEKGDKAIHYYYEPAPRDAAEKCLALIEPHSPDVFTTPTPVSPADLAISRTYVVCEKDNSVLLDSQEQILATTPGMKAVRLTDSGHSPFLSHTDRLVEIIVEAASS
ncbi:Alpha/beta hydrolase fold-1 [Xylariales sp. AK1849]|nr:Alpha/beta hydrolase fold-1 [Xylariales sp. AK1849]